MSYTPKPAFSPISNASAIRLHSRDYQRSPQRPISSPPANQENPKKW